MDKHAHLEPAEFTPISPFIVEVLVAMLDGHAWLASIPSVHVVVLAVAAKYKSRLREAASSAGSVLADVDQRRALIYLRNADPRVAGFPDVSVVELFDEALRVIATSGRASRASAAVAFERAILSIVDVARRAPRPR